MRKLIGAVCAVIGTISPAVSTAQAQPAAAQPAASSWSTTFNTDVRYYGWTNTLGGRGAQIYAPLGALLSGRPDPDWKLSFLVRSGYIWSRQATATASSAASSPTDTNFTPTATYLGWNGITPFMSISFNPHYPDESLSCTALAPIQV